MRILDVYVDSFLSTEGIQFECGPLTLLFGANSTGKTTLLEALRLLFASSTATHGRLADPLSSADEPVVRVVVALDEADLPGSRDSELLNLALRQFLSTNIDEVEDEVRSAEVSLMPNAGLRRAFIDRVAEDCEGLDNGPVLREFAERLLDGIGLGFLPGQIDLVSRPRIEPDLEQAVAQLALNADNRYGSLIGEPFDAGEVLLLNNVDIDDRWHPHVVDVELEPADLPIETMGVIEELHQRLLAPPVELESDDPEFVDGEGADSAFPPDYFDTLLKDPWLSRDEPALLEALVEDSHVLRPVSSSRYRLRPTFQVVANRLAHRANELLPSFVTEQGCIAIDIVEPELWRAIPARIRIGFVEGDAPTRELGTVGAGVARWIAAAIRLASLELRGAKRRFFDSQLSEVTDATQASAIAWAAHSDLGAFDQMALVATPVPAVMLIDEPEAHLHPRAIRSVARWLEDRANENLTVVAATHHPLLLNPNLLLARRYCLTRSSGITEIVDMDADVHASLRRISNEVGLTEADIFLFSRLVLFFEGEHDRALLEAMFGIDLARAGVTLIPLRGIDGIALLPDAEVVWKLGIRAGVLVDHVSEHTKETRLVDQLTRQAERSNRSLRVFPLRKVGIEFYLADEVCRSVAPKFPGWKAANDEYRMETGLQRARLSGEGWKKWLGSRYGLHITTDSVAKLAGECARQGRIPQELTNVLREIASYAGEELAV